MAHNSRVRLRPALTGITAAAALLTAGCSTSHHPQHPPATSSTTASTQGPADATAPPQAPITPAQAKAVLQRYSTVNNEANARRSPALNAQIETGALQAQSQAEFRMYRYWSAQQRSFLQPFTYIDPVFYIPRQYPLGQTPWFLTIAHGLDSRGPSGEWTEALIFIRTSAGWRLTAAAVIDKGQKLPTVDRDAQGYPTVIDPDTTSLAMAPAALPAAVTDNYLTGGRNPGAIFAATPATTRQRSAYNTRATYLRPYGRSQFVTLTNPYPATYALRTTDGGALVIATSAHGEHDYAMPGGAIALSPHAQERAWEKSRQISDMTVHYTCIDAAAIPKTGKARQLGSDCETTNVT